MAAAAVRTLAEDLRQVTTAPARPGCRRVAAAPALLRRVQEESVAMDRIVVLACNNLPNCGCVLRQARAALEAASPQQAARRRK